MAQKITQPATPVKTAAKPAPRTSLDVQPVHFVFDKSNYYLAYSRGCSCDHRLLLNVGHY